MNELVTSLDRISDYTKFIRFANNAMFILPWCLRDLQILHIDPDNAQHTEAAITALINQIEMKIRNKPRPDTFVAQRMTPVRCFFFRIVEFLPSCLVSLHC